MTYLCFAVAGLALLIIVVVEFFRRRMAYLQAALDDEILKLTKRVSALEPSPPKPRRKVPVKPDPIAVFCEEHGIEYKGWPGSHQQFLKGDLFVQWWPYSKKGTVTADGMIARLKTLFNIRPASEDA